MMERLTAPEAMRAWSRRVRGGGNSLAFVPTMGALHQGHLSLVALGRQRADRVVASVFVNPTQFGPGEDFERYPRDPQGDAARLESAGADAVWFPETADLYPEGASTWVVETELSARLEGAARPGHFRGVTTVVTKLLQVVEPDLLILGQKDAQQVAVLRRMLRDLRMPVELVVGPTVREGDGLALSSRNAYLSDAERRQAVCLHQALRAGKGAWRAGEADPQAVLDLMRERIEREPDARIDYIAAVDGETFQPVSELGSRVLLLTAVRIGAIRLIDNLPLAGEG
jgi:pantoate--beta-alanine ligase